MSWLLSSKRGRGGRGRPKRKPRQPWDGKRVLLALRPVWVVLAVGAVAGLWWYSHDLLSEHIGHTMARPVQSQQVKLAEAPPWMSEFLRRDLRALVANHVSADPLQPAGLEPAVAALAASPWVKHVEQLERTTDGVTVHAQYRQPVAVVESGRGYHLVDGDAVRLPGVYARRQVERIGLPVIVGAANPAGPEGEVWAGDDLAAGLALVKLLAGEPYLDQIQAFDVSGRDTLGRIRLALHTRQGLVRWGLPPGQEQSVEPDAQTKKRWLSAVHEKRGAIDAGGKIVDVFGAAVFVHQPGLGNQGRPTGYSWSR